jgi:hypothetical protein
MASVAKVIDLGNRKRVREDLKKTEKLEGLQSLLRCNHCAMRCGKCGSHGEATSLVIHHGSGIELRLCSTCLSEYHDLLAHLESGPDKLDAPFWHNREWIRQWLAWLDYQWAMRNYLSSPEVLEVLIELSDD